MNRDTVGGMPSSSSPLPAGPPTAAGQHPSLAPGSSPTVSPEVRPSTGDGDHERFAHICKEEDVTRAYITGEAIEALCGKKWVPSRDPEKFPVCPACKEALGRIRTAGDN